MDFKFNNIMDNGKKWLIGIKVSFYKPKVTFVSLVYKDEQALFWACDCIKKCGYTGPHDSFTKAYRTRIL